MIDRRYLSSLMTRFTMTCFTLLGVAISSTELNAAPQDDVPMVEQYLTTGKLNTGRQALLKHLEDHPDDQQARFGLGTIQFLSAVEHLGQSLYRHGGIGEDSEFANLLPIVRMAVPTNSNPTPIDYRSFRQILQDLADDLAAAEKTLSRVDDPQVHLPLHFGLIQLDLNDDGKVVEEEKLWRLYANLNRAARLNQQFSAQDAEGFVIDFDLADAYWLQGYCHLLTAICETVLAYDFEDSFKYVARQTFASVAEDLKANEAFATQRDFVWPIAEVIASIHLAKFELTEPMRMQAARQHLLEVIQLSRKTWQAVEAETDNHAEWLPSPNQTGVIPNIRITKEMIATWHDFLDESEQLLEGEKLIPHWQFKEGYGVNLKRIFDEPTDFDLVMWAHGDGLLDYTEQGECTSRRTWNRFEQMFGGEFIGFAIWFN